MYTPLQLREIFHIEFLRWFGRSARGGRYAVKGGANLRFFYKSVRYSEDMDLDVDGITVFALRDAVMKILLSGAFASGLKPFGVGSVVPPDMKSAKQTQTTQRFKVHLMTASGEDLFTKVEFSRRGFTGGTEVQMIDDAILRYYRVAPVIVSHYDASSAIRQKIAALAARSKVQARDVFDLHLLGTQHEASDLEGRHMDPGMLTKALENVFAVEFDQFKDTVLAYLSEDDRALYDSRAVWDDMKLKASGLIEGLRPSDVR
jgi:predicted nucleotidyltransferase component of viral defense system